jgi:hypothetical protein
VFVIRLCIEVSIDERHVSDGSDHRDLAAAQRTATAFTAEPSAPTTTVSPDEVPELVMS